jgi:ferrochelatase
MRNWTPLLPDVLTQMAQDGVRCAIGVLAAAHRSYSSCGQYKENVLQAREAVLADGHRPVDVTYVGDWHLHDGFLTAVADQVVVARETLPPDVQGQARLIFTAHSVPTSMAGAESYRLQLRSSAAEVARRLGIDDWDLVFQSRSGRPEDPWLAPDVNDYLRDEHARGGLRASAVNAHPAFVGAMADMVVRTWETYKRGRPLTLVHPEHPDAKELPPPVRPRH